MYSATHRFSRRFLVRRETDAVSKRGNLMFEAKGAGIGFLKATRARNAEEAIGVTEGLVTVLRLTQADIKSAENTLTIAKQFYESHQYAKAVQAARRAESIAVTLDERFGQYERSWTGLQSRIESMKKLGLSTESLEKVAGSAEEKVLSGIWENGAFIPNYLEASAVLNKAEQEGRAFQEKAEMASNRIYVAELAIEALANLVGSANHGESGHADVSSLEQSLQDATKELALSNALKAADMAKDIEAQARSLRSTYADTTKSLDELEANLADLRSEGALTQSIEADVKIARDHLGRGSIETAAAMTSKLQGETKSIGEKYRKATTTLGDAELLYSRLQREGFHSYEADAALREARRAIREGTYGRSISHLERALQAFARRTNVRVALAKSLEETRTRVRFLAGSGLSFMPDIQEVLERAEREFKKGNYGGSSEDLRIATVLLDGVTRAPGPKK